MKVKPIPDGYHAVTPYILSEDVNVLITFLEKAFNAKVTERLDSPAGTMHAEVKIRDSVLMMGQAGEDKKAMPAMFYIYVEDVDEAFKQAKEAGGISVQEPQDQFYGDRVGAVKDSHNNQWWIATHIEELSKEELAKRAEKTFAQMANSK